MIKKILIFFSIFFSIVSHADTNNILVEKTYYCLKDENSKIKIAFDRYNSRISHNPFKNYNKLKIDKTTVYDEVATALETTYSEYKGNKKIATFTFISKGNEVWGATYKPVNQKSKDLDEARFNLSNLKATCF